MPDVELADLETQVISDGGYFMTLSKIGENVNIKQLPITVVEEAVNKASTAIQPEELGSMASEDTDGFVSVATHQSAIAALQAVIDLQTEQIALLFSMIGSDTIQVYETDVYEEGVYV